MRIYLPRQTQTFLKELFASHGRSPRRQLGQNFLIDLNLLDLIAATAGVTETDVVLEIGTGAGALTELLAPRAAAVVAVEIDPFLADWTARSLADQPRVTVVHADALDSKSRINPTVLDPVRARLAGGASRALKLVANLPYHVATPVIMNLLVGPELSLASLTVTIQWEVAERLMARPGTKDYGAVSVMVQALAGVRIVRHLPPQAFWPRPKVASALVQIVPSAARRQRIEDLGWTHWWVRQLFLHRRKTLRGVIQRLYGGRAERPAIDRFLADQGLGGEVRAERLGVDQVLDLARQVRARLGDPEQDRDEP